jgi:hypothetical protein
MLALERIFRKHAVQNGICVSTQYLLYDREEASKFLIVLAGRRTSRMQTYLLPSILESDVPQVIFINSVPPCTEKAIRRHFKNVRKRKWMDVVTLNYVS